MQSELRRTPYGEAVRPRLNSADTKHSRAGIYHTRIRFTAGDAAPIVKAVDEARSTSLMLAKRSAKTVKQASRVKPAEPPYIVVDDGSGDVEIRFRMKAVGTAWSMTPKKQAPAIFAPNRDQNQKLEIEDGDTIRVAYFISTFYTPVVGAGVTLDMRSVQVFEQARAKVRTANDYGFSEDAKSAA
jgi:hypothetical protein